MSIWGAVKSWVLDFPGHQGGNQNDPAFMSPTVQSWQRNLALVRTLYGGNAALYAMREVYLPRHPKEDPQDYYIRANRPVFYNAFGRTVRALAGIVCRTPPTPEGVPQEILDLYEDDIDNEGTDGPSFVHNAFQDGLTTGLVGIFVNQDSLPGEGRTRADELNAGIRPYWELIRMDDIVSVRSVKENGKQLLAQLAFRDDRQIPWGEYGVKIRAQIRVYKRLAAQPAGETGDSVPASVTEIIYEKNESGNYVKFSERKMPEVEDIPLAPIYTERLDFFDACPPLIDLACENLLHYQTRSDLHHAAHIANVPFLFGIGIDEDGLQIGPNRAVLAKSGDQSTKLQWMETTGASLGSTRAILGDIEEHMANLGLGMLQRKSRAAETAQKATIDKQEQDSTLSGIVGELEDGLARALDFTAIYKGIKSGGRFSFSRDFAVDPAAAPATEAQGAPPQPKEPAAPGITNNPKTSA